MSAFLMKAVDELHDLVQHEHQVQDVKERLLNDIEHLEKVVMNKLKEMRRDIEQIK
jgi:cell division protein ZapA (FtsZ GTPase activity inhibitor)